MILHSCKAYGSPVRGTECTRHWPWWRPLLPEDDDIPRVRRLHLKVVDLTRSRRLSTKVADCSQELTWMTVLPNVGTHFPSHGSKIRNPMSYDMSLSMLWMALTCRATSSGRNFPALLNATLWGLRSGHTSLCVQGFFFAPCC